MPCLVTLGLGEKHQSRCKRELDSCLLWCVSREPEEVAIMLNCIFQAIVWPATLLMLLLLLAVIVTLLHESLPSPRRPSNMSATAETTQRHTTCQAFGNSFFHSKAGCRMQKSVDPNTSDQFVLLRRGVLKSCVDNFLFQWLSQKLSPTPSRKLSRWTVQLFDDLVSK